MPFTTLEKAGGKPVELYAFARATSVWRYTSAETAITWNGDTYVPAVIERTKLPGTSEQAAATVTVSVARNTPLLDALPASGQPSTSPLWLTVYRVQRDELSGSAGDRPRYFRGEVKQATRRADGVWVDLTVALGDHAADRVVPRWTVQRGCNYTVYDEFCTVDKAANTITTTVSAISGQDVTVSTNLTAGDVRGGWLEFNQQTALIRTHDGTNNRVLHIQGPLPLGLLVGSTVKLYRACDGSWARCNAFGNTSNYGGFYDLPLKNPYRDGLE
jgi:hypothetical protein